MLDKSRNMLISNAFRKANITSIESEPTEAEIADAAHTLNVMLQSWNNDGFRLFKIKDGYMPFIPKKNDYSLATQAYKSIESTKVTRIDRIGGTKIELTNYANIAPGQKLIVVNDVRTADNYITDVDYDSGIVTLQNPLEYSVYANDIVFYGDFYTGTTPVKRFVGSFNTLEYDKYTTPPSAGDAVWFCYNGNWQVKKISTVSTSQKTFSFSGDPLPSGSISNGIIVFGRGAYSGDTDSTTERAFLTKDYTVSPRKLVTTGFNEVPDSVTIMTGDLSDSVMKVESGNKEAGTIILKDGVNEDVLLALGVNKIVAETVYPSTEEVTWQNIASLIPIEELDWGSVTDTSDLETDDWGYVTDVAGTLLDWGSLTGDAKIIGFSKSTGTKYTLVTNKRQNITNKITYVPEDIKLELSDGTLTIKSGTKAYLGDGTVFTKNDNSIFHPTNFPTTQFFISLPVSGSGFYEAVASGCVSAATNPGTGYIIWYNTTDGKCYHNDGAGVATECTMPIAIVGVTNGVGVTSIDQVFNGYGHIGSKAFVLPGLKALAPNGRDENGNFVNTEITIPNVLVSSTQNGYTGMYLLSGNNVDVAYYTHYVEQEIQPDFENGNWYNPKTNKMYRIANGTVTEVISSVCLYAAAQDGKITSFEQRPESESVYNVTDYYLLYDAGTGWTMVDLSEYNFTGIGLFTARNVSYLYDKLYGLYALNNDVLRNVYTTIGVEKILQYRGKYYLVSPKAEGTINRTVVETEDFIGFGTSYTISLDSLENPAEFQSRLFIGSTDTFVGDMKTFSDIEVYSQSRCVIGDRLLNLNTLRVCSYTKDGVNFYPMPMMLSNQTAWGYKDGCSFIAVYGILNGGIVSTQIFTANDFNPVWTPQVVVPGRVTDIFFDDFDAYFVSDVAVYSLRYRNEIEPYEQLKCFCYGEQIGRPQQIMNVMKYGFDNQVELPLNALSLQEFTVLPRSGLGGEPVNYCFMREAEDGKMMVWGTPSKFGEYLKFSYVEPLTLLEGARSTPDFPDEYYEAVENGLAAELSTTYGVPIERQQALAARAQESKENAMLHDNEDATYNIVPNQRWL